MCTSSILPRLRILGGAYTFNFHHDIRYFMVIQENSRVAEYIGALFCYLESGEPDEQRYEYGDQRSIIGTLILSR